MKLGIASTSYMGVWRPKDTHQFLEHCHALGAAGIQAGLHGNIAGEATTRADVSRIRARAEQLGLWLEAMVVLPDGADTGAFEQALKDARKAGATAMRAACLGLRRYEAFATLEDWKAHVHRSHQSLTAAVPLLEKYKIPLGLENHKDWAADEMAALMNQYSSPYLGVCLDFGNNISLLDDPMEAIEKLAPFAVTTHVKDMAIEPSNDGFLMSEVPLGSGYLDLPRAIRLIQQSRPQARFSLEMITRDPLQVPCLTDKYWTTFPSHGGFSLARILRFVNEHQSRTPLPRVAHLANKEQLRIEDKNVSDCLEYARANL